MTANVIASGAVGAPSAARPIGADPSEDGSLVDDTTIGKAGLIGFLGGAVFMTALCFAFGLIAGLEPKVAIAVAPIPGVVAGLFFGMTAYLGGHLARHGH